MARKQRESEEERAARASLAALEEVTKALGRFLGAEVDIAVFAGGVVDYHVRQADGTERTFAVPHDPPFPVVMAFLHAYDRWQEARFALAAAQGAVEEAADRAESASGNPTAIARLRRGLEQRSRELAAAHSGDEQAWEAALAAFLPLLQIRTPDVGLDDLRLQIGATQLEVWMRAVVLRLSNARQEAFGEGLAALLSGGEPAPKAPGNRAGRRARTRTR